MNTTPTKSQKPKITVPYEYTDTFNGEANYSWVKRGSVSLPEKSSDLAIVRAVKKEIGLSGVDCKREIWGDQIVLKPKGYCRIVFIG